MIEIKEYKKEYAKEISNIVLSNLYTINVKDYDKEFIDEIAIRFTETEIKKDFPKRTKCFVALEDNMVVGTASIDKYREDETGKKYIILTVFVKIENHHKGIGKILMDKVESYAKEIGVKELVVPASIYALEFYKKLGYEKQNEEKEYMLVKYFD